MKRKMLKYWAKFMNMNIIKAYFVTLGLHFLWTVFVGIILLASGAQFSQHVASNSEFTNSLFLIPCCAIAEEVVFRWLPFMCLFALLGFASRFVEISNRTRSYGILMVVALTSIIFGYVHGNFFNIFIQGVSGAIFCAFYIRALIKTRAKGKKDKYQLVPLASSSTYHMLANSLLIIL